MARLALGALLLMLLTACGQQGPLYLPETPPAEAAAPTDNEA
ncbi:LPS translocon maturation chaperone LptM [Halomonas sp. 328]|nr:lipoprotein [Halomonas sp. 328]